MAAVSHADYWYWNSTVSGYGTTGYDSSLRGKNFTSTNGVLQVQWSGYASPNKNTAFWRIKVYDLSSPLAPAVVNATFTAYGSLTNYNYYWYLTPGRYYNVTLYACGNQSNVNPSWLYNTFMRIDY